MLRHLTFLALLGAVPALAQPAPADTVVLPEVFLVPADTLVADEPAPPPRGLVVEPEQPTAGVPARVTFDAPIDVLLVTYRPGSAPLARTDTLRAGGATSVEVTFEQAGVARIALPGGPSRNVSVRFARAPLGGIAVLVVAGLILFGGAAFAMAKMLESPPPGRGEALPPI